MITGLKGSSPAVDRDQGMKNVLAKYPAIKVLVTGDGKWIRDPAVKLMEDYLTAYPKIDAVFSHAEEFAWGAQLAVARADRRKDDIKQYTFDGSNAGFKAVKAGAFQADGNYTPYIADIGLRAALYTLMKKPIPGETTYKFPGHQLVLPDSPTVVADNADQWIGRGWGDFEPTPDSLQEVRCDTRDARKDPSPSQGRGEVVCGKQGACGCRSRGAGRRGPRHRWRKRGGEVHPDQDFGRRPPTRCGRSHSRRSFASPALAARRSRGWYCGHPPGTLARP